MNDNVILITFDSLSAKDMSLYGYRRHTTPFVDSFAGDSYVFENTRANSNSTIPALASILTSRYPARHRFDWLRSQPAGGSRAEDLGDVLKSVGYRTAAAIGMRPGYLWIDSPGAAGRGRPTRATVGRSRERSISGVTTSLDATFRKTLEVFDSTREPLFLWLHLYPPHRPYLPSRSFRGIFVKDRAFGTIHSQLPFYSRFYPTTEQPAVDMLRGRYDEHILEIDHKFGGFLESMEKRGLFESSIIVLTSDHGEMFERGYQGHGGPLLYDPLLHIPLIVRLPNGRSGGRVTTIAEQVDIAPTILDLLGCDIPRHMRGESLVGAMLGGSGSNKPKFSVSAGHRAAGGRSQGKSMAVVVNGHKLILNVRSGACELYDLARDPAESTDLAAQEPETGRDLKQMIFERFANDATGLIGC